MKGRTALQIRRYGRSFLIVIALIIAGVAAGAYILGQERLANPFAHFYKVDAAFPTAAAVVPGLGEPVDVAGVHVGEITGVQLHAGQGIVQMQIDPGKGVPHLFRNASAQLTPTTPLKDMYVDIDPGSKSAGVLPSGGTIPIENTTSPIDSDELTDELDVDTRDWFTSLITSLNTGLNGRGQDLKRFLQLLGPTARQSRQIADLLADRRTELAALVHNVGRLSAGISVDDGQLGSLIDNSDTTLTALANENGQLGRALSLLPGTLSQTARTLTDVRGFSGALTPTAQALIKPVRQAPRTLADARTLVRAATVLPVSRVRALEQVATPLSSDLAGVQSGLAKVTPNLTRSFKGIQYITNELAYSGNASSGNPGFLYWLAWFAHNVDSFVGNRDANGTAWRLLAETTCTTAKDATGAAASVISALQSTLGCS